MKGRIDDLLRLARVALAGMQKRRIELSELLSEKSPHSRAQADAAISTRISAS